MSPHLKELLALFGTHEVRYLVIGGYALAAHGAPRYTKDLDLWIEPTADNLERLARVLRDFGFDEAADRSGRLREGRRLLQIGSEPNRVDLLNFASGVRFEDCIAASVRSRIDGIEVPIIGRDDLIRNKTASGRFTDLADLERLGIKPDREMAERALAMRNQTSVDD